MTTHVDVIVYVPHRKPSLLLELSSHYTVSDVRHKTNRFFGCQVVRPGQFRSLRWSPVSEEASLAELSRLGKVVLFVSVVSGSDKAYSSDNRDEKYL